MVNLGKKFRQKQRETLATWLLQLHDTRVGPVTVRVLCILTEGSRESAIHSASIQNLCCILYVAQIHMKFIIVFVSYVIMIMHA